MAKHKRRSKPYQIIVANNRPPLDVSAHKFHEYIGNGWLVPEGASKRLARPRAGVNAWLEEGTLRLWDMLSGVGASIPSSWRWVEQMAIYCNLGPRLSLEERQREIQAQYVTI